jgi:hypothetical protein
LSQAVRILPIGSEDRKKNCEKKKKMHASVPDATIVEDLFVVFDARPVQRVLTEEEQSRLAVKNFDELLAVSWRTRVAVETLISLHGQRVVKAAKQNTASHKKKVGVFLQQMKRGNSMLSVARQHGVAPCMLARMVVAAELALDASSVSRLLKQPAMLPVPLRDEVSKRKMYVSCLNDWLQGVELHVGGSSVLAVC